MEEGTQELILATNPSVEEEATMLYIANAARGLGCEPARLASGLPVGATWTTRTR